MRNEGMSAIILAGGKSSRMGENKLLLPLDGQTIISRLVDTLLPMFKECIIVTDNPKPYSQLPVRVTPDILPCPARNSLVGIYSGLSVSAHDYNLVVAGDMPFVHPGLLQHLCDRRDGHDVVMPNDNGYFQPLCAVYSKKCLPHIKSFLARECYKITDFLQSVRVEYVPAAELRRFDPELLSFFNVNTPADYTVAKKMVGSQSLEGKE